MQTDSLMVALFYVAGLALHCLIYTALIWFMMRVQHLNYTVSRLFAAAAIATAVAQIPLVGPYVNVVVLLLCLRRFTGEAIIPDLVFTVVVAGALMFAVNLWFLATVFPDVKTLRSSWLSQSAEPGTEAEQELPVTVIDLDAIPPPVAGPPDGATGPRREPSVQGVVLKGVTISRQEQFVLVACGPKSHSLKAGEHVTFDGPRGPVDVQCESVTSNRVWIQIRGPARLERVELRFKSPSSLPVAPPTGPPAHPTPTR